MAFLTDRTLATGVTLQDLIHIVIPTDVSQNPAGSSYKVTIQQVSDVILSGLTGNTQLYEVGSGTDSTQRINVGANASGNFSFVGGGEQNTTDGCYTTVVGGCQNTATSSGGYNFIGGGMANTMSDYYGGVIVGGYKNTSCSACYSVIGGGQYNVSENACLSVIGGGERNTTLSSNSTISGGRCNTSIGNYSTLSGGYCNTSSGDNSTVSGGKQNTSNGDFSTVSGGYCNTSSCNFSTVSGGYNNTSSGCYSFIGGGRCNSVFGNGSSILGGIFNTTISNYGTILGGSGNTINHKLSAAYGKDIISKSANTFHVNYLALQNTPETDPTNGNILVRDSITGVVKQKASYTSYVALLTQSGTNDPSVVVLENNIGNIVWTRNTFGVYEGTLTGAFVSAKTALFIQKSVGLAKIQLTPKDLWIEYTDANTISIYTTGETVFMDDVLNNTTVEIRVYP